MVKKIGKNFEKYFLYKNYFLIFGKSSKEHRALGVRLVTKIINLTSSITYWADEIEIVSCLASLDWRLLSHLSQSNPPLQDIESLAFNFYLRCLKSKDGRIREAALECTVQFATGLYGPRYIHKVNGPLLNRLEILADGYLQRLFPAQNTETPMIEIPFDNAAEWMISYLIEVIS